MDFMACRHLLIFGGTFDPPHRGHVELPPLVAEQIGADGILYIPAGVSPFKIGRPITSAKHRLIMLRLATASIPNAFILTDEIHRSPSYTVDTLEALKLRTSARLRLLIGADQLRSFDRWRQWRRIVELAEPVVMVRPPFTPDTLLHALPPGFDREEWEPRLVRTPLINVSSTDIRRRAGEGRCIDGRMPLAVVNYIRRTGLYRQ